MSAPGPRGSPSVAPRWAKKYASDARTGSLLISPPLPPWMNAVASTTGEAIGATALNQESSAETGAVESSAVPVFPPAGTDSDPTALPCLG